MIRFTGIRRTALLMTVFFALLLAGCGPSVVGKWEGNMAGENPMGVSANGSLEFKPDGKFEQKTTVPMAGAIAATGTYKVNGEKVDLTTEDVTMGGKSIKGMLPAQITQQVMSAANQSITFKVEGDKLTLDTGKGKATLTRAKQ